ncbi:MAG: hypothetical protein JRI45_07620 [Deltaproteobacteria bacterium]|nr:hypothetical protein [Deltaproteobacteria bacterium]MBW2068642.1 hypothetical protein [Deltaproteobacteria bacterium]
MMKKVFVCCLGVLFIIGLSGMAMAKMGSGKVTAKSSDVDIKIFGSMHTYPTYVSNPDFNSDATPYDFVLDENGYQAEYSIRNEARLGFAGSGENWSFLMILESDFTYNKQNGDRGANRTDPLDSGMTGEDFGIEKLEFDYNFGYFTLETGWQTKFLDLKTGGVLYGDDHPFIGLKGTYNDVKWEILSLYIFDDIEGVGRGKAIGPYDANALDWRAYTAKVIFPVAGLNVSPFYAYSENNEHHAYVNYIGAEAYGKLGMITPRAEFVYAVGNENPEDSGEDYDISAFAAFGALEFDLAPYFKPYIGGYYISGDGDANDHDIDAFNPITNISRYTPTFGMENAFIYKYVPVLGSHLYSNAPDMLGGAKTGYGGIGNVSSMNSPGMMSIGVGAKGTYDKWQYKAQFQYFWFADEGALEDIEGKDISDELGMEFDLQITYKFNKHFSIGNVISVFDPGDAIEDLYGDDYDETAFMNTVELKWQF